MISEINFQIVIKKQHYPNSLVLNHVILDPVVSYFRFSMNNKTVNFLINQNYFSFCNYKNTRVITRLQDVNTPLSFKQ